MVKTSTEHFVMIKCEFGWTSTYEHEAKNPSPRYILYLSWPSCTDSCFLLVILRPKQQNIFTSVKINLHVKDLKHLREFWAFKTLFINEIWSNSWKSKVQFEWHIIEKSLIKIPLNFSYQTLQISITKN